MLGTTYTKNLLWAGQANWYFFQLGVQYNFLWMKSCNLKLLIYKVNSTILNVIVNLYGSFQCTVL